MVAASHASDCLALTRASISTDHISTLHLQCDDPFTYTVNGRNEDEPREVWKLAVDHLLSTYQPRTLEVHPGKLEIGITAGDTFHLPNRKTYDARWNDKHHAFIIEWLVLIIIAGLTGRPVLYRTEKSAQDKDSK